MFEFIPFAENHFVLFENWLKQEHVKRFWTESKNGNDLRAKLLASVASTNTHRFVIQENGGPIGYVQYYDAVAVGEGWWSSEKSGTFGMDIFIGVQNLVGRGLGPKIIREFVSFIRRRERHVESVIIDPSPENHYAISAYKKAGFAKEGEVVTPDGVSVLMRMRLS